MLMETEDYKINYVNNENKVYIEGSLRLPSPNAYTVPFEGISDLISNETNLILDISGLNFLNSSGVSSFAGLILLAKKNKVSLSIICNDAIPWQAKTTSSFKQLYVDLEIIV